MSNVVRTTHKKCAEMSKALAIGKVSDFPDSTRR